jgi:dihydrolipoamide dehydrogenase
MRNSEFDITVIGSGPGGYVAAIRAAQLGYKTAIVEKYNTLGGTCTNVGCIPSKALLDTSKKFYQASQKFEEFGIDILSPSLNVEQVFNRKDKVVDTNTKGIQYLMSKNKIEVITGTATFVNNQIIDIKNDNESKQITSSKFIIATGSKPSTIPGVTIDKKRVITSTEALSLKNIPNSLVIIGGGVIGCEMASIFNRFGTKVTILEYADTLIPNIDKELGKALKRILSKEGIEILLNQKVQEVTSDAESTTTYFQNRNNELQEITSSYTLVAVGRKPYTEGLGLENTKIELDEKGKIVVNQDLKTHEDNIYAIGDVVQGPMLAHKAEEEGVFVAETINGQKPHINYKAIPSVVYTWPEVASVGKTEEELIKQNINYNVGKFPFSASSRARAAVEKDGFVKILSEPRYGEVLGVHIIGPRAADLIAQAVVAIEYEVTAKDMYSISYAHPTYSEALKDAFRLSDKQEAINI